MRTPIVLMFLIVAFCINCRADDIYLTAGVASTDRAWGSGEYAKLAELIASEKVPAPRISDPVQKKIFERVCSEENLEFGRNKSLPAGVRLQECVKIYAATGNLLTAYVHETASGAQVSEELTQLMNFLLKQSALCIELVEEFAPTLPKDETYEGRMQGLAKMKSGLTTVFSGIYTSIAIDVIYSDAQRSSMLKSVAETVPKFASVLSKDTRTEFALKYTKLKSRFKSEGDQSSLEQIVKHLQSEPNGGPAPAAAQP